MIIWKRFLAFGAAFLAVAIQANGLAKPPANALSIIQSAREVPLVAKADVVVVGGSSGAVAAAVEAANNGAKVFLVSPRYYLGDDMAGVLRLYLEKDEVPQSPLAKALFESGNKPKDENELVRVIPYGVKEKLDQALIKAGVQFIYASMVTDVLRDADGKLCGVVIANRSGRQAIAAGTIIDATERATVARLAGADFTSYPAGVQKFTRIVVGAPGITAKAGKGITSREIKPGYDPTFVHAIARREQKEKGFIYPIIEYTLEIPMADGSYKSFAEAEQIARDLTYDSLQQNESERLFQVPPDHMKSVKSAGGKWQGVDALPVEAFKPAGLDNLYVLGGCADVSREQAAKMLRPLALIDLGTKIGKAAAKTGSVADRMSVAAVKSDKAVAAGEIKEVLKGFRPMLNEKLPVVSQDESSLPVLGEYDVVVVGGGTSGAPAGIAAARKGAKTLVLEYQYGLGGVSTEGFIFSYHHGNRVGFTEEVTAGSGQYDVGKTFPSNTPPGVVAAEKRFWEGSVRMEWFRSQLRKAGGELWFGTIGCGAVVKDGRVTGVVVVTPQGRGIVLAKTVVDASGNSDIAAAAGAECKSIGTEELALQGVGLSFREMPWRHVNSDFTIADECDLIDVWHVFVYSKTAVNDASDRNAFDMSTFLNSRERRRIIGDYSLDVTDIMARRLFPDTIVQAASNMDTHGFNIHSLYWLGCPENAKEYYAAVPYRSLLPKGLEGILVTGLAISAHRDAMPYTRMIPDMQNQGYATGYAAAMAAEAGLTPRQINVRQLQEHLVSIGVLEKKVLDAKDPFPVSEARLQKAVKDLPGTGTELGSREEEVSFIARGIVLADPRSVPLLQKAMNSDVSVDDKHQYAVALAIMGDASGADFMLSELKADKQWDAGWFYSGPGNIRHGIYYSKQDVLIHALGHLSCRDALPVIIEKAGSLTEKSAFSHLRAVAMALETIGDPSGADVLAKLLKQPGMSGWSTGSLDEALALQKNNQRKSAKELSFREIMLARALYRCGDKDGLAKGILEQYAKDYRGIFARHAQALLAEKPGK